MLSLFSVYLRSTESETISPALGPFSVSQVRVIRALICPVSALLEHSQHSTRWQIPQDYRAGGMQKLGCCWARTVGVVKLLRAGVLGRGGVPYLLPAGRGDEKSEAPQYLDRSLPIILTPAVRVGGGYNNFNVHR